MSLQEKQLALLVKRQAEFKTAALKAKKSGQIEQAKEYLRQAKGFDSLIEASKGGLPVNFKTLPVLPTKGNIYFLYWNFDAKSWFPRSFLSRV